MKKRTVGKKYYYDQSIQNGGAKRTEVLHRTIKRIVVPYTIFSSKISFDLVLGLIKNMSMFAPFVVVC